MSDIEFIQLGREVLNEMPYVNMYSEEFRKFDDKMKKVKIHILDNPNNKFVKDFIDELLNRFLALFFDKELMESFYIQHPFYRQIQVCKNLPYNENSTYLSFLFYLLELSSFPRFYPGFLEALTKYKPEIVNHPHLQALFAFIEQNENIIYASKDNYRSLVEEKELCQKAYRGEYFKEIDDLIKSEQPKDPYTTFTNKRVGNIGELYTYELLRNERNCCFVARDVKNGFGYDIYFLDRNGIETLVEVKTTANNRNEFEVSENEYRIMKQCIGNPLVNYIICRVNLDSSLTPISYTFLTMADDTTLIDISTGEVQYKGRPTNNSITFEKCTPKVKVITQP